jgi:hypothetical protein
MKFLQKSIAQKYRPGNVMGMSKGLNTSILSLALWKGRNRWKISVKPKDGLIHYY